MTTQERDNITWPLLVIMLGIAPPADAGAAWSCFMMAGAMVCPYGPTGEMVQCAPTQEGIQCAG
jgi:hypothetical protein